MLKFRENGVELIICILIVLRINIKFLTYYKERMTISKERELLIDKLMMLDVEYFWTIELDESEELKSRRI
jgi:hypothetical protein